MAFVSETPISAQGSRAHGTRGLDAGRNGSSTSSGSTITSTGQSGTGANIDVIYHRIYWRLNPDSINPSTSANVKAIVGNVQFNFKTIVAGVNTISFDLNGVMGIDSIQFHATKLSPGNIARSGNITTITLPTTLGNNVIDSFRVWYGGTPPGN